MALPSLEEVLTGRLEAIRSKTQELRVQFLDYTYRPMQKHLESLRQADALLDDALIGLAATQPNLITVRDKLAEAQDMVDIACRALLQRIQLWERVLSAWAVVVLLLSAALSLAVWQTTSTPSAFTIPGWSGWTYRPFHSLYPLHGGTHPDASWLATRALLLAICGGLIGTAVDLSRMLYDVIPNGTLQPRRILWYFLSPLFGAALAGAVFLLVRANMLPLGTSNTMTGAVSSTSVFALGFFVGFIPSTVHYRIRAVVKAFFGTDEVSAPAVAPPQIKQGDGKIEISTRVTASAAVRVTSVTAIIQAAGGPSPVGLKKMDSYTFSGEYILPAGVDWTAATVTVEARDDAGNVGRSEPVSLAMAGATAGGATTGGAKATNAMTVAPATASVAVGGSQLFTATGATGALQWSVKDGGAGGAIDAGTGQYTAPASAGTDTVIATDQADTSKTATAVVTITA